MGTYTNKLSIGIAMLLAGLIIGMVFVYFVNDKSVKPLVKGAMTMRSPDFVYGGMIPEKFSCIGDNMNPTLYIENVPSETKSLALVVYDASTPGKKFLHWMLLNVPPNVKEIPENSVPRGSVIGLNDYGKSQYDGPCPPAGNNHKYIFRIYALDMDLGIRNSLNLEAMEKNVRKSQIDYADYEGYFSRH
jgi:Raf kinase inhibitor-like YbhB/YbcL family protein